MIDLHTIWFGLVGILFAGYAILDGFDLGIGALHLLNKTDVERRTMIQSIGPVWDGNEVWLVTGGGALFAAFPEVYATVFSGFYFAFILLLFALIFRALSIEFRSRLESTIWRKTWDICFSVSSIVASLLLGVALGNIVQGIPLDEKHEFIGSFFSLLNPYALLVGIMTVGLFTMHGSLYASMKTEGNLQSKARGWAKKSCIFFAVCYGMTTIFTICCLPHSTRHFLSYPIVCIVPVLSICAIANVLREIYLQRDARAFLSSSFCILTLVGLVAITLFPNLVFSQPNPDNSLTISNSASSAKTLQIMLIIACIGMPFVLGYTIFIYKAFRGKVSGNEY